MRNYIVKEVTKQGSLTIAQLEPKNSPLLLEDEVPPGCIQHIITNLLKHGNELNQINRICELLCNVHMNDASRKISVQDYCILRHYFFS